MPLPRIKRRTEQMSVVFSLLAILSVFAASLLLYSGSDTRWIEPSTDELAQNEPGSIVQHPSNTQRHATHPSSTPTQNNATRNVSQDTAVAVSTIPTNQETAPAQASVIQESVDNGYVTYNDGVDRQQIHLYNALLTPNDPNSGQWWETNMNMASAWDLGTGSTTTTLAIIDTGFALDHEEFVGRWHINTGESGSTTSEAPSILNCTDQSITLDQSCNRIDDDFDGVVDNENGTTTTENPSSLNCTDQSIALDKSCNRIDDDGNGLVDDYRGWDFLSYDNSVQAGHINPTGIAVEHGTSVTGVAAATANNGVGIAGVNWNTKILPIQALADDGYGTSVSVARSIRYAVQQGADVISMSLGGTFPDAFLRQTISEAIADGIIVVAASGNSGCDCISYPGNYPEVVTVGALSLDGQPAGFSSYGKNLDILAPGVGIYSTGWSQSNPTQEYAGFVSGTSIATPLVSGALTSLLTHQPTASTTELLAMLTETTDRTNLLPTESRSNTNGYGTANMFNASVRATTPASPAQATSFSSIGHGNQLFTGVPLEATEDISVYACNDNLSSTPGTTPVHYLEQGPVSFYSASLLEVAYAEELGYDSELLGYFCTLFPHDTPSQVRIINTVAEFSNTFKKPSI